MTLVEMGAVTIRKADRGDAARLALVGAATFLDTFAGVIRGDDIVAHCRSAHAPALYEALLTSQGASAWLAEAVEGAAPVGYALLMQPELPVRDPQPDDMELKRIYVLSRFHGTEVGSRLMNAAAEEAIRRGAHRLLLGVYAQNQCALAFYAKHGFSKIGERQFQVGANTYGDDILARPLP